MSVFYWIGVTVSALLVFGLALTAAVVGYALLISGRFNLIFFRKGRRRLSLASWHATKLTSADCFDADDFPINERPFYLSYRVGKRRAFVMFGLLDQPRYQALWGRHPEESQP